MVDSGIIAFIKKGIIVLTIICIPLELLFFPSWGNLCGCIMMATASILFILMFLQYRIVERHLFSFMMFLSMFLYRFLPIPMTLLELHPVSYKMNNPIRTFLYETLLYCISCAAYYCAIHCKISNHGIIRRFLKTAKIYHPLEKKSIWIIGVLGLLIRILSLVRGMQSIAVVGAMLMIAPVLLFFPNLYDKTDDRQFNFKNKWCWLFLIASVIVNFGSNTRTEIVTPFAVIVLLCFVTYVKSRESVSHIFTVKRILIVLILLAVIGSSVGTISKAMLVNRAAKGNYTFTEMIQLTIDTIFSGNLETLWNEYSAVKTKQYDSYDQGWTEEYVDNFIFNRFCNIRITDEVLYLKDQLTSEDRALLLEDFGRRLLYIYPTPLLNFFGVRFDKSSMVGSRGDMIYFYSGIGNKYSIGGLRVTSHLGDGLATFGWLYFPLQFIMFFFVFQLLDLYVLRSESYVIYSPLGLIQIFSCMILFRNSTGINADFVFCLRGFWQVVIIYAVITFLCRIIVPNRLTANHRKMR